MFGRRSPSVAEMLSEIQTETGAQASSPSPLGSTGLPGLDVQLLSTATKRTSPSSSLNRGDVLEIQGPAASGKTHLVYRLTMQCILPEKVFLSKEHIPSEVEIGGWEKSAIIMDTDGRWSAHRLKLLLIRRLEKALPSGLPELRQLIQDTVTQSLRRLHVFRIRSSASLAATLFQLPLYHSQRMSDEEIGLLSIDSISSFYWIDRHYLEQQRQGSSASNRKDSANPLGRILMALQEFRLSHGPVIVLTNWGLTSVSKPSDANDEDVTPSPFYRQHLHPFPAPLGIPSRILPNAHLMPPITHHITLILPSIDRIPLSVTSLQEALELTEQGSVGIRKRDIMGILRTVETGSTVNFTIDNLEESCPSRQCSKVERELVQ
ncbi:hypothetical protein ACEPAG_630 [Sanghuangporus baumii]